MGLVAIPKRNIEYVPKEKCVKDTAKQLLIGCNLGQFYPKPPIIMVQWKTGVSPILVMPFTIKG